MSDLYYWQPIKGESLVRIGTIIAHTIDQEAGTYTCTMRLADGRKAEVPFDDLRAMGTRFVRGLDVLDDPALKLKRVNDV